jgi:DNA-directed RNA polymerase specialized sigma24 family protein
METDEFRHLMRRHGGTLLAFIEGITHSRKEAEDILQEAFVCAYRSISTTAKQHRSQSGFTT